MKLTIASYNIRKAVGLDWRRNPERIENIIGELDADIVVLQEADKRLGQRPSVLSSKRLHSQFGLALAPMLDSDISHGHHGNALFYSNRLQLLDSQPIVIPSWEPRGCISALFGTKGIPALEVIGVHLGLTGRTRRQQMDCIREYALSNQKTCPTIIVGDFNEWRGYKVIAEVFGENFSLVTPGPSFHAALPRVALDHFVISNDIHLVQSKVHITELSKRGSDHLPIVLNVELPTTSRSE